MNRKKVIIGNWKMHGDLSLAKAVAGALPKVSSGVEVVLCPPATLLHAVASFYRPLGGQNCHARAEGAFTGDISARMLKEAGADYVIVGHSERRQGCGETNETVKAKAEAALAAGLTPVVCVGESEKDREAGNAEPAVAMQVRNSLPGAEKGHFLLAYEPVWAIGSGRTPTGGEIAAMHAAIAKICKAPILYGGSVKAANAAEILAVPGVAGALVGGASLKVDEFCGIIAAAPRG